MKKFSTTKRIVPGILKSVKIASSIGAVPHIEDCKNRVEGGVLVKIKETSVAFNGYARPSWT